MAALHYWELGTADELLIGLVGPMTRGSTSTLRALLSPHWDRSIELDLARCTGIDLDGALALAAAEQAMVARGGHLRLRQVSASVQEYLRAHHLEHLLADTQPATNQPPT
ncbi:MAG: STAS domain-containing protein [Ornithinimicrobium sp.]